MEEISFTQEQLDEAIQNAKNEWVEKEFNPVVAERDELLQFKPKELSDEEKAMQTKQQELFQKEVSLELKSAGLEKFAEFFNVEKIEDLQPQIEKFQGLLNEIKVEMGYVPADHKKQNEYDVFATKGDTKGMIATKLSKLFG
ncbi:hypothetical protein JGK52_03890 [Cytobacillus oceanisediminis]|uniref:hypothetical protein n=1 Tax=Cytobacillus oceanisediminis TaxID=665099 RepID=UPI001D134D29|nr:hypothetical protein [Cytobacillus oceanisediminis]MCC3645826.1 hypothetical protein [Cytobacillus oceanisediminis]